MASRRRLLHVFSTFNVGGPQVRFATIAARWADRYHHVITAMDGGYAAAERLAPAVSFTRAPIDTVSRAPMTGIPAFRRHLDRVSPDLLVTYNWGAVEWGLANWFRDCPHIHIEDGFGPEEATRQIPRRVWFRRLALRRAVTIALPSRRLYDIATRIWKFDPAKVTFLPNGIDCTHFARPVTRAMKDRFRLDGTVPVIGTLGALRPEKNFSRLIRAAADAFGDGPGRLIIAGQGPEHDRLESERRRLGLADEITLAGHVDDPAELVAAFDIFALSSDTEQMPVSVLEAMAAGKPVVSTDVGDVRHMVAAENRPYVSGHDQAALAENLRRLLADPALRREIGEANQARVRQVYDQEPMFVAWDRLFSYPDAGAVPDAPSPIGRAPDPV